MKELRQKSTELKEALRSSLSPRHHAMLYAYIVRSCRRLPYDDVEQVIEKITVEYGRRRGRRMAARAARDKMPLTALNYEAYQEWQALPGDTESGIDLDAEEIHVFSKRCPWYDAWQANDMLAYGRPYCRLIDEALVSAFNESIAFETAASRTNGGEACDFYFRGLKASEAEKEQYKAQCAKVGNKAVKSWDFHIGDLYDCAKKQLLASYGDAGREALDRALCDYRNMYGPVYLELLTDWDGYDFESVDDYPGAE